MRRTVLIVDDHAAYRVVSEAARSGAGALVVSGEHRAGRLVLEVETHLGDFDVVGLHDRLGALDGRLELDHGENGRVTIRAELPCVL